ncbi:MAG: radical SAM protein [Planctomycetaceae bacterium]|nr:MAG: radical SAM protein [Planctomycetaceae bacterium]
MPAEIIHTRHDRIFATNRFVYPVISRRSGGLSIGVNLNPDKICNFDCIYCQVDRTVQGLTRFVDLPAMLAELEQTLEAAVSGRLFQHPDFSGVPSSLRRLNDIAFSGDGEPTSHRNFDQVVAASADLKRRLGLDGVKMILITNASLFHRPHVQRGLEILDANQGEIWAKLDAGSEDYFRKVERTPIKLARILENITQAARERPLVIQSLFMRIDGESPDDAELTAYCQRLREIVVAGGRLKLVQICTVARRPAEAFVQPLKDAEVDRIVQMVRQLTELNAAPYYGVEFAE